MRMHSQIKYVIAGRALLENRIGEFMDSSEIRHRRAPTYANERSTNYSMREPVVLH